jgi:signal transduction histidine kinase
MVQLASAGTKVTVVTWRGRPWLPSGVALLAAAAGGVAILVLRARNGVGEPEDLNWWLVAWVVVAAAYGAAGAGLVTSRHLRVLGLLFLVVGGSALLAALSTQYGAYAVARHATADRPLFATVEDWAWALGGAVLVALVPWRLDSSHHVSASRVGQAVAVVAIAVFVGSRVVRDLSIGEPRSTLEVVAGSVVGAVGLLGIVALWRRTSQTRTTTGDPLAAWLLVGTIAAWLSVVPWAVGLTNDVAGEPVLSPLLLLATVPLLVLGALIELVRDTRRRGDRMSSRVVEWAMLAMGVVLLYTGVVAGLGTLLGGNGPTWLLVAATGAIALLMEPARDRIRQLADHLVYGSRDDPLTVVQSIVDQVGADSGDELLPDLVESLARELRLDAVAIDIASPEGWVRAAAVGQSTAYERVVLLRHRDEVVGRLVVGWMDGPSLRVRDEQVLEQLAGAVGLAVSWVRLAVELRRSGLAVVSAREEERRRLRRDLHDGVGPALTGISLGLHTAVKQLERGPGSIDAARDLLVRLSDQIDSVVSEIKQIVRDLRPTALDELGLVGAITEFTRRFAGDLDIDVDLSRCPTTLPAAIEVAAYRIVTEAVTNVVRHARARRCRLTITAGRRVMIDVEDDGVGIDGGRTRGVGLTAMRERAAELGGAVRIFPVVPHGTHLHVELPAVLP